MAYSALPSKSAGDTIDLTDYNAIKGNFEAGVPDIFTTKGDIAAATAANAAARVAVGDNDSIIVADSTQSAGLAYQIVPSCRVYNDANIDPAASTWVTLTFNSERFDTDSLHSVASNTGRITVPSAGDGLYLIGGNVSFDTSGYTSGAGWVGLRIVLNAATVIAQNVFLSYSQSPGTDVVLPISTLYSLSATDYVTLQAYTQRDVDVVAAGNFSPEFWAVWQRRQ